MHVALCCTSASAGKQNDQGKTHVLLHCRRGCKKRRGLPFVKLTMGAGHVRASRTCPRRLRDGRRKLACHACHLHRSIGTSPRTCASSIGLPRPIQASFCVHMPLLAIETKCLNTPLHPVVSCHSPIRHVATCQNPVQWHRNCQAAGRTTARRTPGCVLVRAVPIPSRGTRAPPR
jgi:hypothetical protein